MHESVRYRTHDEPFDESRTATPDNQQIRVDLNLLEINCLLHLFLVCMSCQ